MTGSLQVKNGNYYIVLNLYENGKRKPKWISTGLPEKGNKRRAEQMLREMLLTYKPPKPSDEQLFSDCVRQWLSTISHQVDEVTRQGYEVVANTHVIPYFDENRLKTRDLTVSILQSFFDEKAKNGRKDGKGGLSPASLRRLKNIVNQAINTALRNGLLVSNPCQLVTLPKQERYQSTFYSATQLQKLFEVTADDPLAPLIRIAALYGLRRSELLGLQWDSIDFDNDVLTIRHTVAKVTKAVAKDKTKNASSHRSFPLTPEARAIFEKAKAEEQQNRQACGKDYNDNPYVFKWADGRPFAPEYVTQHFALLLKKHGLPHIRFHELRHSCASLLLNNGYTLKDVQEWMGHADITMTVDIKNLYEQLKESKQLDYVCKMRQQGEIFSPLSHFPFTIYLPK